MDELDQLLGLRPKFDIPPGAQRTLTRVGILDESEGGLPPESLSGQPASIVRAALTGLRGPMVSRWGHILARRALASRLGAPAGMDPVDFAALRAAALNTIGEHAIARAVVQDVGTADWNANLTDAGLAAYLGTADLTGACPVISLQGRTREDPEWILWQGICTAFGGETSRARANLQRALRGEIAPNIDVLLAQRYAGAAGQARSAVNIEWDDVDGLTPWRFAAANALGETIPAGLMSDASGYYLRSAALSPALPLEQRAPGIALAAREGLVSSSAMVDFYAQLRAGGGAEADLMQTANDLRAAYIAADPAERVAAIRSIWGGTDAIPYDRQVLTAYAAARIPVSQALADDAGPLIASMLAAGLERDAMRWASVVVEGSAGWSMLALAQPVRANPVTSGQFDDFVDQDESPGQRRSAFLLAGLSGLDRMDADTVADYDGDLSADLARETRWSRLISAAGRARNQPMVSYLAAVGMQGSGWDKMTARHLYHIVSALNDCGLQAEARMIAAEAIARA